MKSEDILEKCRRIKGGRGRHHKKGTEKGKTDESEVQVNSMRTRMG